MSTPPTEIPEIRLQGIGVSQGIAWGMGDIMGKSMDDPEETSIDPSEVENEKERFSQALIKTKEEIFALQKEILAEVENNPNGHITPREAESRASIFDAHLLLLEDAIVLSEVVRITETHLKSIDWAYYSVITRYIDSLRRIADPYLRERAVDIEDVARRVIRNLRDTGTACRPGTGEGPPVVLLAHDLTPSDTVGLDRSRVIAFATELGSPTSHTAIMAKSLNIPAVVALHDIPESLGSDEVVLVDGYRGLVIINPSADTMAEYAKLSQKEKQIQADLQAYSGSNTATLDGQSITLSANIEFVEELPSIRNYGAEGIGLYRTEFFYLSDKPLRTEENQYENYKNIAEAAHPHSVIIRTLDLGGDKLCPELYDEPQPNPFLGWRGIRVSLDRTHEFRVQLRAILRASSHGKIRLMFPFISNLEELQKALQHLELAKDELRSAAIPFDEQIEVGAMIEIPSAVMIADHLAKLVDFFSIGSNDLIQYTTAVDRVNDRVAYLYQPTHPAVIKLIRETVEAAHRNNIWCGICGEVASDLLMTPIWVGLGVDELSVGVSQVLKTRRAISSLDSSTCQELVATLKTCGTASEIKYNCLKLARSAYPELLLSD